MLTDDQKQQVHNRYGNWTVAELEQLLEEVQFALVDKLEGWGITTPKTESKAE